MYEQVLTIYIIRHNTIRNYCRVCTNCSKICSFCKENCRTISPLFLAGGVGVWVWVGPFFSFLFSLFFFYFKFLKKGGR